MSLHIIHIIVAFALGFVLGHMSGWCDSDLAKREDQS